MEIFEEIKDKNSKQRDHVTATFRRALKQGGLLSDDTLNPLCLALITFDGHQLVLESACSSMTIQGRETELAFRLLKECDGTKNITEIIEKFQGELSRESAIEFLEKLQKHDFICDSREACLLLHNFGCNPSPYFRTPTDDDILEMLCHPLEESIRNLKEDIRLPAINTELSKLLSARISCRDYDKKYQFSMEDIANLLWCTYGVIHKKEVRENIFVDSHTVPSGGALYPLEIYVAITKDNTEIPNGIYRYRSEDCSLILCSENICKVLESVVGEDVQESVREAGILLIISGYFPRSSQKYSNRGYLYTLYEAGAAMQNCYLAVSSLNLGCCAIGGFKEHILSDAIGFVDYPKTMPLLVIAVGKPKEMI